MKVLVGVSGGIAAYKAAELVRALQGDGFEVQVAITRSAEQFITPLTFAALTGRPVFTSLWEDRGDQPRSGSTNFEIEHISVATSIDALVVAPATANTIAKFAHGLADDFLSTLYLATTAPVLMAPAMNVNMWQHAATQANVAVLRGRGVRFVEPDSGYLACGMVGSGRLAPIETIAAEVRDMLKRPGSLAGETVLVTAGGTREPLDPVRFLGNRSSGKMGHALAQAAVERGAHVILITAAPLASPAGCDVIRVETAEQMSRAVHERLPEATIVVMAAAVADYRAKSVSQAKLKRSGPLTLYLEPTEDIVAEIVTERGTNTIVVAFAAETENLEENALAKLARKGADAIVANDVSSEGTGFDAERNAGFFITPDRTVPIPETTKIAMAARILDEVSVLRQQRLRGNVLQSSRP